MDFLQLIPYNGNIAKKSVVNRETNLLFRICDIPYTYFSVYDFFRLTSTMQL